MSDRVVAAFDVDNTLTVRDCVVPFLRRVSGSPRLVGGLALRSHRAVPAVVRRDRDTLKELATAAALGGRHVHEVERHGREFGREVTGTWLRADTVARLHWHREQGHGIVLVSASFEVYLDVVADHLGADAVLATRLHVEDDRVSGRLEGANCRGPEKVRRLHAWLEETYGGRHAVELFAYGDSAGDRELLADADRPLLVGRSTVSATPA